MTGKFDDAPSAKRRKSPARRKKSPINKRDGNKNDSYIHHKITELQAEKEKLISEKTDLKLEVYELKKKISAMRLIANKDSDDSKQLESNFNASIENKDKEIDKLTKEIKNVEKQRDELLAENEKLQLKNMSLPEITLDESNQQSDEQVKLDVVIQDRDKEIERLLQEIKNVEKQRDELLAKNEILEAKNSCLSNIKEENTAKIITKLKNKLDTTMQIKNEEIERLLKAVKTLETENTNLQTENERLRIESSLLSEIPADQQNNKDMKKQIIELKNQLNVTIETKDKEIQRLSKEVKSIEIEKGDLQCENERLRNENCSYQLKISMAQGTRSEETQETVDLGRPKNDEKQKEVAERHDKCQRESTESPTDEEIAAIMKEMIVPPKLSPCRSPTVEGHQEGTNRVNEIPVSDTNTKRDFNRKSSRVNPDLQDIVSKKRNFVKKRQIVKSKHKKVDLFGTLLALKKANINFIISSDSLMSSRQNLTCFKNTYPKGLKLKHKPKIMTVSKELTCNLSCCTNNYMILRGEDEDASLLGFVGVKNEITVDKESFGNQVYKKRRIGKSFSESVGQAHVDRVALRENNGDKSTSQNKKCNSNDIEVVETEVDNDEGYQSYQSGSASSSPRNIVSIENYDVQSKVRRSKRKMSVIKNIKEPAAKKLAITECPDVSSEEVNKKNSITNSKSQQKTSSEESSTSDKSDDFIFKKPASVPKSPKTTFKRPVCNTRRSQRLISKECNEIETEKVEEEEKKKETVVETPKSPTLESKPKITEKPVVIPLEKVPENGEKMQTSKIEMLFNKLIVYSKEEEALNDVVKEFASQQPEYIAEAILERIALDYHDRADTKYSPAPLMTDVQRTMLGFMSKLEKSNVIGVFDSYLTLAEQRLLTCNNLQEFEPITRLYLATCKLQKNLTRMRKLCCDVFYFCGDLAVPFFFTVLTSWTEVLPHEADAKDFPIARVLVQTVYMKDCNKPGYNLMPLRDLLIKFYGYPTERWDYNEFFKELFDRYLKNPTRSSDFALLLYCKNRPEKWVYEKIEEHLKPLIDLKIQDNFKATLIILISNLYNRFSSKSEVNYLPKIRDWLNSLVNEETPDVVKRCVYLSLIRLKKK